MGIVTYSGQFGPHQQQGRLRSLYSDIYRARRDAPKRLRIDDIYAFHVQKHGMRPKDALAFGMVVGGKPVVQQAGVMGGISAGIAEPGTHASIKEAISFFEANMRQRLIGLNVGRPAEISAALSELDAQFRGDSTRREFSHIGAENVVGIGMMAAIALAERSGVPLHVALNYRYNEVALGEGLAGEVRPMSIPVNYSVVWEGGKHGAALSLPELVREGIITDTSRFPARFSDPALIAEGDSDIQLAIVPPQETQVMVITDNWSQAREIGIRLTNIYEKRLKAKGISVMLGAESGFTTKQVRTSKGELITLELILGELDAAVEQLGDDAKRVRYALDIAASEIYIPEIDMYYIGPSAAGNADGLVTNEQFTAYKLELLKRFPRFSSVEDWAKEDVIAHWVPATAIMDTHIQMGDDNTVSFAPLIREFAPYMNAHLEKPNQSTSELEEMRAVATSHALGNVVVYSHRGTRPELETYTAEAAMGTGSFGGKWTLLGVGRGALIAAMSQAEALYRQGGFFSGVQLPYQGALVLDPNGPYANNGWAKVIRQAVNG